MPVSHFVCGVLFHAFLLSVFFNHLFLKIPPLRNALRLSNSLDPDQFNKQNVGPDLDQSFFLQR